MTNLLPFIDLTIAQLILCLFAFFFAAFVKGTTGIGFASTAIPLLVLAVGLEKALPLVLAPSMLSNLLVMRQAGGFQRSVKRFWPMFLITPLGLFLGVYLLATVDRSLPMVLLGLVLIAYGIYALRSAVFQWSGPQARVMALPAGFLTGFLNGLTGSQLLPIMPYLMGLRLSPNDFVQTMNISFMLSSILMTIGLQRIGFLTLELAVLSTLCIAPVFVGTHIGGKLRAKMDATQFRRVALMLLVVLGIMLIGRALFF